MKTTLCSGLLLLLACSTGCQKAVPTSTNYSVEAMQNQLVVGEEQKIEVVVKFRRSEQPAASLNYQVQFSAPGDLTVTPKRWDVAQNLTTNDAGFNYTGVLMIGVAGDAAPGEREVTVIITPAQGVTSTATLKFHVVRKRD
jgi:hypothetical protein